jgi:hypothetical protein
MCLISAMIVANGTRPARRNTDADPASTRYDRLPCLLQSQRSLAFSATDRLLYTVGISAGLRKTTLVALLPLIINATSQNPLTMVTDMTLASNNTVSQKLSYTSGPTDKPLWTATLGALAEIQAEVFGDRTALVFAWQNERRTYRELFLRSNTIAKSLLESGLQHGDCVGIFAGNCITYLEVFLGASFIGCPVVVLNSNYTPPELDFTVGYSGERNLAILSLLMLLMSVTRMQAPLHRAIPWA